MPDANCNLIPVFSSRWRPKPISDEEAFESIKAGIDAQPEGVKMILNSGEFYAQDFGTANLELVSRFFEKYPEYADRAFLSVKVDTISRMQRYDLIVLRHSSRVEASKANLSPTHRESLTLYIMICASYNELSLAQRTSAGA